MADRRSAVNVTFFRWFDRVSDTALRSQQAPNTRPSVDVGLATRLALPPYHQQ